jgi:diketogulonate reductase-like aldo/keto reductase
LSKRSPRACRRIGNRRFLGVPLREENLGAIDIQSERHHHELLGHLDEEAQRSRALCSAREVGRVLEEYAPTVPGFFLDEPARAQLLLHRRLEGVREPQPLHAFDKSARKLGVDRLDLLLLHQPLPSAFDRTLEAYRALEKLLADGRVRAIGVSNFMPDHLERLLRSASVVPAVNQIEVHPYFQQTALRRVHAEHGIATQAWSPIGGITAYRGLEKTSFADPTLLAIARQHGKSAARVMLRWHLQQGRSAIPKSTKPAGIAENFAVFDFELTREQLAAIDALDTGVRGGPEPDSITLESYGRPIPEA